MKTVFFILSIVCLFGQASAQITYYDASEFPLLGKISDATETRYERLPQSLKDSLRDKIWELGKNTAGLSIRFRSNSSSISVRWRLLQNVQMNHMSFVGIKGVDLYALTESGEWRFVKSGKPTGVENEAQVIANMLKQDREYMLYLPLYDGVTKIEIGIDSLASIGQPQIDLPRRANAIVYYGTSITQGGCASRPGMAHTNILSRTLNCSIINLGFSGNGLLDYEIADLMSSYSASLYIIDCMPNVNIGLIDEKLENFYRKIRSAHPCTPILLIENPIFPFTQFDELTHSMLIQKNKALGGVYEKLKGEGDTSLFLLKSKDIIGSDGEATVDGIHFTDLGFMRYANVLESVISKIINDGK